jgi:DNA-binding NarL/FixJ family response regulator
MADIKVFIVDDNFIARRGLRSVLEVQEGITVAGEASSGIEALQKLRNCDSDVILMDVRMPEIDGVETTVQILKANPNARVLLSTVVEDPAVHMSAILAGARGYLVYGHFAIDELAKAVRAVAGGGRVSLPPIPELTGASVDVSSADVSSAGLTPREQEILKLISAGNDNREIAATLKIEEKTVKNHINSIYSKLGVPGRREAIYYMLGKELNK